MSPVLQWIRNTFVVDENTGKVYARQTLDYETREKYQFFVTVADNGRPPKSSQAYITVNVIDLNDNPPVIDVNVAPGGDRIEENRYIGKYVAVVKVTDVDVCSQGKITCDIEDAHFSLSTINPAKGINQIKLSRMLDREEAP
ncbi:Protocadherin alpha-10 [Bulinus truncatus]|nr:Protocadherin alpha-10 [Bulinus truncatus]